MIFSLYVINKAGGLIAQTDFPSATWQQPGGPVLQPPPRLSTNDYLVLAGTFHGIHAITSKLSPPVTSLPQEAAPSTTSTVIPGGLSTLEADTFRLHCYQTLTGIKFILLTHPAYASAQASLALQRVYEVYADHAMKNPFYTPEMPIRSEQFDRELLKTIKSLC